MTLALAPLLVLALAAVVRAWFALADQPRERRRARALEVPDWTPRRRA